MNKSNLLIALTTIMLLTSCGGTKYTKTSDPVELQGIRSESREVLTMYEETFKLEVIGTVTYSESAAAKVDVTGKVMETKTKVYTGTFEIKSGLISGSTVYDLQASELKYSIRLSEAGKNDYKTYVYDREKGSYTEEQAKKLAEGGTITVEDTSSWNVTLDALNETFAYTLGL